MPRIYRPPAADARLGAEEAFEALRIRLMAAGVPPTCASIGFERWAALARRAAPRELAAFIDAGEAFRASCGDGRDAC